MSKIKLGKRVFVKHHEHVVKITGIVLINKYNPTIWGIDATGTILHFKESEITSTVKRIK